MGKLCLSKSKILDIWYDHLPSWPCVTLTLINVLTTRNK